PKGYSCLSAGQNPDLPPGQYIEPEADRAKSLFPHRLDTRRLQLYDQSFLSVPTPPVQRTSDGRPEEKAFQRP
ncbi:MAG: hypothetical protein ACREHD_10590, partial [Pirellulales bacterium]